MTDDFSIVFNMFNIEIIRTVLNYCCFSEEWDIYRYYDYRSKKRRICDLGEDDLLVKRIKF